MQHYLPSQLYAWHTLWWNLPSGTWDISQCMPTLCLSWSSPDSCSGLCSLSKGCVQPFHLQWWHRGSCTHPELQPNPKSMRLLQRFNFQSWINKQNRVALDKPPAIRRHSVFSWCWAEGHSEFLSGCLAPVWRFPQEPLFCQQPRWHTQTWWESRAELPVLMWAWLRGVKEPLARHRCTRRAQVLKAVVKKKICYRAVNNPNIKRLLLALDFDLYLQHVYVLLCGADENFAADFESGPCQTFLWQTTEK